VKVSIHVGTSGFHYRDWVGPFYPEDLAQSRWLEFYSQEFDTCELNYTFYRQPDARQMARMAERVPEGFVFSLKAYRGITHEQEDVDGHLALTREALEPLVTEGNLGALLFQFPHSFRPSQSNASLLERCREALLGLPLVAEFRNREWLREEAFDFLGRLDMGYCCVDEPALPGLMPPVAVATAQVSYVRFHGRNAAKWWNHQEAWERYNYRYSAEELAEWVPKIQSLDQQSTQTYVYTNNHWQGQAVDTARQLRLMLESPTAAEHEG
jgi:uncharacterized protein YecE (DUF72 family)